MSRIVDGTAPMFERVTVPLTLTADSVARFTHQLTRALRNPHAPGILLIGSPDTFCRGIDLDYVCDAYHPAFITQFCDTLTLLRDSLKPVMASVQGDVIGSGLALLGVTDLVLSSHTATFHLPEAGLGLTPTIALACLAERIAPGHGRRLAWASQPTSAHEAFVIGLVDQLATPRHLDRATHTACRHLGRLPEGLFTVCRRMHDDHDAFENALTIGGDLLQRHLSDPAALARIRAYRDTLVTGRYRATDPLA